MINNNTKSFVSLIEEINNENRVNRDRGTLFELLCRTYLENEPMYQRLFDKVWMLNEVPTEYKIPKSDTGVDLVARKSKTGELVAIQCKYYSSDTTIRKEHIDSFLNEVGKSYYDAGMIITTTDKWTVHADNALHDRNKTIMRISLSQLKESRIDWTEYSFSKPKNVILQKRKVARAHQVPAIDSVLKGFQTQSRGKLIMAPGTGKTFTSMAIAEKMAEKKSDTFKVLYLVPSIQLLSQTLRSWNADTSYNMESIAVCSDRKVTKERIGTEIEDIATADIGFPSTTSPLKLLEYQETIKNRKTKPKFISIFSTYQSIDAIIDAQKSGFYDFDLIICDEAHRTTGATELGNEESAFTKVHNNDYIKSSKRLYQTATPRIYGEDVKKKADEKSIIIADMNDTETFGPEFYRIGFGDAIRKGILTDYKVMVLAVDEDIIARRFQDMFTNTESGLQFDDVTKIIGCWNGLVKRDGKTNKTLGQPMKRAIAFTGTIKDSKNITEMFSKVVDEYLYKDSYNISNKFKIDIEHADGTMNAIEKNEKIDWLKSEVPENTCRVLSNARFLTEGVDVPDLDAVIFLKPRKSKIDIAQAVGRVMRKAPGKDYGYIILPIGVPAGAEAHSILNNHEKYAVVWEILNALRSIDERFDATINKLALNKNKPQQLEVIGIGDAPEELDNEPGIEQLSAEEIMFSENLTDLERAIYGKIVKKVGNVRYWEQWSEDVAKIAEQHITRINIMLEDKTSETFKEFQSFMNSIHQNINNSITDQQAIEMLAQHLITKPVFEALFDTYSFVKNNPVSQSMDTILEVLDKKGLLKEQEKLEGFYESVRLRAEGIDNLKAKQDIIINLYNKFFKVAFKETADSLGIVFTPVEVVDFIINSVEDVLQKHFSTSLTNKGVHVLDPFTGTGTFITRLLQSNIISKEDLLRKYTQEIHANEIVLLSYYIAAINIEETFHSLDNQEYVPFEGIVLTDTFESTENKDTFMDELFNENNKRLQKQQDSSIFAIIGNPPYSMGQKSENSRIMSSDYPKLTKSISETYAQSSSSTRMASLYDSYIKALRWSTDRLKNEGVIAFVTNSSFVDFKTMSGLRKSLYEDFNHIYVFNLRGAIRERIGDEAKREGQNVFDILTGVAIVILVKDKTNDHELYYNDIGDYLSKEQKLKKISDYSSINKIEWINLKPDLNNDWINQRDINYQKYTPMGQEKNSIFYDSTIGITTSRDYWVYGFGYNEVVNNSTRMISNFNSEIERLKTVKTSHEKLEKINVDDTFINWSRALKNQFTKNRKMQFDKNNMILSMYRPFTKKWLYHDKDIVEMPGRFEKLKGEDNLAIYVTGPGIKRDFSALMIKHSPEYKFLEKGRGFLKFDNSNVEQLFKDSSNINNNVIEKFDLSPDDMMYYIYGVLHSNEYKVKYNTDLRKALPRIPVLENKDVFVKIGRELADIHLNYEDVKSHPNVVVEYLSSNPSYKVKKMKYYKRGSREEIVYNEDIIIKNIPEEAYDYIINGRPAIEWIIDQYKIKTDKKSHIIDDPNNYSDDKRYILNLLLSIINVSVQTVDLSNSLPPFNIKK